MHALCRTKPKDQIPNPKQLPNFNESKIQPGSTDCECCVRRSEQSSESSLEFDVLGFVWDLEPGIWDFRWRRFGNSAAGGRLGFGISAAGSGLPSSQFHCPETQD